MSAKVGKRNPVFQADELNLLNSLVYKYKHVLENKQKGAIQVVQKTKYWNLVTQEFISAALNNTRTAVNLKKCWENRKTGKKAELCVEKGNWKKTGGGPQEGACTSDVIEQFLTTVTDVEVHGTQDSDSLRINVLSPTKSNLDIILQNYDNKLKDDQTKVEMATVILVAPENINLTQSYGEKETNYEELFTINTSKKTDKPKRSESLRND